MQSGVDPHDGAHGDPQGSADTNLLATKMHEPLPDSKSISKQVYRYRHIVIDTYIARC